MEEGIVRVGRARKRIDWAGGLAHGEEVEGGAG